MELDSIFYEEDYSKAFDFLNEINRTLSQRFVITEIEPDTFGRRFQIVEIPKPTQDQILDNLRTRREEECFSIINRGVLWYNLLTTEQQQELNTWYQAWLDVPQVYLETKPSDIETIIPEKPSWLK